MVCVPLVAKDHSIGLIVADNAFSGEPIGEDRVQLVQLLALLAGLALDNAKIYAEVERGAQALQAAFDELRTTQERLIHSERLAAVGAVVARVSHEIRNALATIGGSARRLRANASDPARVAQGTAIIADEVEKLEGLLREMLDFTTPRPPHLAPTDLNQLVKDLAQAHHAELDEHGIALDLALAPALPAVLADAHQLRRVLLNLWRNAREAMDGQAGRERRLTVRTTGATGHPQVEVPDTRPGIPHERRGHLFTPFYTTKPRGSGLGLAIVRKIVDDHGGIIQVGGEPGAGATFVITLQLATR
jgi:signal transduction histidine kinase